MRISTTPLPTGNSPGIDTGPEVSTALGGGKRAAVIVNIGSVRAATTLVAVGRRLTCIE